MEVKLEKWQSIAWDDPHRFKVLVCGRRAGKTTLSILKLIHDAVQKESRFPWWYGAPTYKQAKQIAWNLLKYYATPDIRDPKYDNETELSIRLRNDNKIALKGFDNPTSLEGLGLEGIVVDEASAVKNWTLTWENTIRPMLADVKGWGWIISKPRGFNHFHTLAKRGDWNHIIEGEPLEPVELDPDWMTFRATSYDNTNIDPEEIAAAKRDLTEESFKQEILARFTSFTGQVYKEFARETHVIEPFDIPENWSIYRGIDFGSTNPTACLWIAVDGDDNWYVVDEHYQTGETIDYHAGIINSKTQRSVSNTFGDPSGAQWINEFAQRGIYITKANKETGQAFNTWVTFGIEKVAERLRCTPGHITQVQRTDGQNSQRGEPSLYVFSTCTNTIREFETYRWKEKSVTAAQDLNEPDAVEKANDHALDALRYFAVSYRKPTQVILPPPYRASDEIIGV